MDVTALGFPRWPISQPEAALIRRLTHCLGSNALEDIFTAVPVEFNRIKGIVCQPVSILPDSKKASRARYSLTKFCPALYRFGEEGMRVPYDAAETKGMIQALQFVPAPTRIKTVLGVIQYMNVPTVGT